jgi:hypothetical protein
MTKAFLTLVAVLWVAGIATGMKLLFDHETRAGEAASAPASWPAKSRIARSADRPTLLMIAHPECPCTRASIGELANLMARVSGLVEAHVVFVRPEGLPDAWERTDLWRSAERIPGVRVSSDPSGREAALFGSKTSGEVLLYSKAGRLSFAGGITPTRAHMGNSVGRERILAILNEGRVERSVSAVFGCPIWGREP